MSEKTIEQRLLGLSDSEVKSSQEKYGTNALSRKEPESVFSMFLDALKDVCVIILLACLGVKVLFTIIGAIFPAFANANDIVEIVSIVMAIALATGFSTLSEYRNSSRNEALQEEYSKTFAKVMRDGKLVSILTSEIVKGDIILLQAGDKVPTDGLLVKGNLKVNQAALNGESRDEKKETAPDSSDAETTDVSSKYKVFMGSVVTAGEAYMEATVIGDASELGKINQAINESDEEERKDTTTLKLEVLVGQIGKLGTTCAVIAGILDVVLTLVRGNEAITFAVVAILLMDAIMLGASIIIMAVPEGLALIVSLVQSMNTESMYKKHILVHHKAAFADSAYMNILFSDKTGTITKGNLSVVEFLLGDGKIVKDVKFNKDFLNAITLNNSAKISSEGKAIGSNNMDQALLTYAINDYGYTEKDKDTSIVADGSVSLFDSEKKCATVDLKDGGQYWKGATEFARVNYYVDADGKEVRFTDDVEKALKAKMKEQAARTMKMLAIVRKYSDENEGKARAVLYAVVCLRDDVRPDAVETVEILNKAGIQVAMITGDAEDTAIAIAKEAGLMNSPDDIMLTHKQLVEMTDDEIKEKLTHIKVVSRAEPMDKQRLVKVAQSLENVVGMTGDGVNDAPALKQADVGFAMGDGTAVAQEAGDVVILNNSLTSIKDAVLNSRTMAKSISKFLIFQLTVNVSTLLMNILAPVLGWTEPFSIVQILWINLIMDTLASLSFGGEPILDRYMNERPVNRHDKILTPYIKSAIGTCSVFITLGSIVILENVLGILDFIRPENCENVLLYDKTFMFAFFIYAIIFNSLNTRSEKLNLFEHIGSNKKFIYIMSAIFVMQTIIIQVGGNVFETTTLTTKALLVSIVLGLLVIPVDMVRKVIWHTMHKS